MCGQLDEAMIWCHLCTHGWLLLKLLLHSIKQPHYPVCEAPKWSFAVGTSSSWQLRDYGLDFQKIILEIQWDETKRWEDRQYPDDWAVKTSDGMFWNMNGISTTTNIVPDILHTVYHGMLEHLMDRAISFLEQHSRMDRIQLLLAMMPPYLDIAHLNMSSSQVRQWSGK